jgi:hypothetical protein
MGINSTFKYTFLFSLLLIFMGSISYAQNDFDRPVLSSFNVSPTSVDISSGLVTLTATINASDTSGIVSPNEGVYFNYNSNTFSGTSWTLISGDIYNGTYVSYIELDPTEVGPGTININERPWVFKDPNGFEANSVNNIDVNVVNNSDNDFDRPVLSSFNVSPTSVDISSGIVTLTATINASDTSGIVSPNEGVYFNYNSNTFSGTSWTLISGDIYNGTYVSYIELDPTEVGPGTININERPWVFKDPNGFEANSVNNIDVNVVNNSDNDFDRPVLSSFNVSPTSVDISSGIVTLTATINASDTSGVGSPNEGVYFNYNSNTFSGTSWTLISGDIYNGTYVSYIELDPTEVGPGTININERPWVFKDPNGFEANSVNNIDVNVVNFSGTTSPSVGDGTESNPYEIDSFQISGGYLKIVVVGDIIIFKLQILMHHRRLI